MKFTFINLGRKFAKSNIWGLINSTTPPLGLALLAAILDEAGHTTEIIDAAALELADSKIIDLIDRCTDIIGIPATTVEIENVKRFAGHLRMKFPKARILFGGVHPSIFHETFVESGVCDLVIRGEAETAVVELADGKPLSGIANLTWRSPEGRVVANPMSDRFVDLERLPPPAFHKLPMNVYRSALGAAKRQPSVGIITSRGCPGACTFCYSGMFGKKIRFISPEKTLAQILTLKEKYGVREISFYDDTFTANPGRVKEICELLISRNMKISWSCFARVDTVRKDLLAVMKRAGCHQIMYGFESSNEDVLKAINKKVGLKRAEEAVALTREAGIDIRGAFMLGNPGETEATLKATIDYAKNLGIQYAIFNITTPYPGTELFEWAKQNGVLSHTNWDSYDLSHAILELPGLPGTSVEFYYRKAYREFYFRLSYILEWLFVKRCKDEKKLYFEAFSRTLKKMVVSKLGIA
ncbi:MAG: radical SAM protein [Candidatus Riflebacteria bacterium]|nr:radical SAM protein [Candidatus Riflebacteria bacterium]